jgi:hypothetical protein
MPYYLRIPNTIFALLLQTLQKTPIQGAWNTLHVFAVAAKWYDTGSINGATNDMQGTTARATESSSLQRQQHQQQNITHQWQNTPSGQYWVNRQPQPLILSRACGTMRIEEQAEALWDWAVQQVHLTDTEIQQLQRLKSNLPSKSVVDSNTTAVDATSTMMTTTSQTDHSKVD